MINKIWVRSVSVVIIFLVLSIVGYIKYNHKNNLKQLLEEGLDGRLISHRINDTESLQKVLDHKLLSFEVDLFFKEGKKSYFEVGHKEKDLNGETFEDYLSLLSKYPIKKIWLDIKNLNENNARKMLLRLNELDKLYAFKKYSIIESSNEKGLFKAFNDSGFHCAYFMPTRKIINLMDVNNSQALLLEAKRINTYVYTQGMPAISFDSRLYPFVKKYLEPMLQEEIVFHTWRSIHLRRAGAVEKLKSTDIFSDVRIKTIIYDYYLMFM